MKKAVLGQFWVMAYSVGDEFPQGWTWSFHGLMVSSVTRVWVRSWILLTKSQLAYVFLYKLKVLCSTHLRLLRTSPLLRRFIPHDFLSQRCCVGPVGPWFAIFFHLGWWPPCGKIIPCLLCVTLKESPGSIGYLSWLSLQVSSWRTPRRNPIVESQRFRMFKPDMLVVRESSGWWFDVLWNMAGLFVHSVGNVIIPTDFQSIIFQRGRAKNHQADHV